MLLATVLCGALVYYNFIDKPPVVETPPEEDPPAGDNSPVRGGDVGNLCFSYSLELVDGSGNISVNDESLRGKVVIINFWYTSCTPCVQELPHFNKLFNEYSDDVVVIAIHEASIYNSNPDNVKKFIDEQFAGYNILFGYDDINSQYYTMLGGKQAWPMTIIVDQEGVVSFVKQGSLTSSALESEITKLLD